jgi:hypothetical protein
VVAGRPALVLLQGVGLDAPGVKVYARHQGRYLQLNPMRDSEAGREEAGEQQGAQQQVLEQADERGEQADEGQQGQERLATLMIQLPALAAPGLVHFELEQQLLISEPVPLLVLPSQAIVQELQALEAAAGQQRLRKVSRREPCPAACA